jgi:hypothetical protein
MNTTTSFALWALVMWIVIILSLESPPFNLNISQRQV